MEAVDLGSRTLLHARGRLYTLHFFIFLLTVRRIRMFFSLKPSASQGESSLKISALWGSPFRRSQGTNIQTNTLTDILLLLQNDKILSVPLFLSNYLTINNSLIYSSISSIRNISNVLIVEYKSEGDVLFTISNYEIMFECCKTSLKKLKFLCVFEQQIFHVYTF